MQVPRRKKDMIRQRPNPRMSEGKFLELETKLSQMLKKRPTLAMEVKRLAELGDFSENAEYQLAKGRLRGLNQRILDTEDQLKRTEIIERPANNEYVTIGHYVTLKSGTKEKEYLILGSVESDPSSGVISQLSPIGSALLGHRVGNKIRVRVGKNETEFEIIKIK